MKTELGLNEKLVGLHNTHFRTGEIIRSPISPFTSSSAHILSKHFAPLRSAFKSARFPFLTVSVFSPCGATVYNVGYLARLLVINILQRIEAVLEGVGHARPRHVRHLVSNQRAAALRELDFLGEADVKPT